MKLLISRNVFCHGGGSSQPSSLFLYLCLFVDIDMVTKKLLLGRIAVLRTQMRPILTDRVAWSVGMSVRRSVCDTSEPSRKGSTDRAAGWVEDLGGPGEPCIRWVSRFPHGKRQILGGEWASHCKVQGHSTVVCAKTAEPIGMLFGLWAQMGRRNHVLDWGPQVLRDVAMATNFGMQFAITGFVV